MEPTHAGIVSGVNIDGQGTITFIHAIPSGVQGIMNSQRMNIDNPADPNTNSGIRRGPKNGCPSDGSPKRAGELFNGFGTIRN